MAANIAELPVPVDIDLHAGEEAKPSVAATAYHLAGWAGWAGALALAVTAIAYLTRIVQGKDAGRVRGALQVTALICTILSALRLLLRPFADHASDDALTDDGDFDWMDDED